ncbi:MAG: type I-U CRISPR-associated protein Csb2 [Acidimicrobiaceae bacterium]|nr:type I-U CRISPR-associated protein Csb2 [Acidimicrobiaceae bacterium]
MISIEVHFLTGRYSATSHHNRMQHEWPPHGARLFSALVATWADAETPDESERAVLEWFESLPPPRITAPECIPRAVMSHFVPVNDTFVVSKSSYRTRAKKIENLREEFLQEAGFSYGKLSEDRDHADLSVRSLRGELSKKAEQIRKKIDKECEVDNLVGKTGSTNPSTAYELLPEGREKKERYFPSVTLVASTALSGSYRMLPKLDELPPVTYVWDDTPPSDTARTLDGLLARVSRLGHSSSLVSCRLITGDNADKSEVQQSTYMPGAGDMMLRWVSAGQLEALESEYQRHQAIKPRSLPFRGVRYGQVAHGKATTGSFLRPSTAGDWIVFELDPQNRRLPITRTVELASVLRRSILSHVSDPLPEEVSGHLSNGKPTPLPHIGFLALPNVGYEYSDGRIMGLAVFMPHTLSREARNATLRGVAAWERKHSNGILELKMGSSGHIKMNRKQPPFALVSLRQKVWARPSKRWASATPIALPTHPGNLRKGSSQARSKAWIRAQDAIIKSCGHVELPQPVNVHVSFVPQLVGARPSYDFPAFKQGRKAGRQTARSLLHAVVEFADKISGPLILGSGRFLGLGLMRPIDEQPVNATNAATDTDSIRIREKADSSREDRGE